MPDTPVLIGVGVGVFFGFFLGWLVGIAMRERPGKKKKEDKKKQQMAEETAKFLQEREPFQYFDVHVAHVDVELGAVIGVEHHVNDLIQELQEQGELSHLLRLVVLGYSVEGENLCKEPDLCNHFLKIHADQPYLPVFLERTSMRTYLRIVMEGLKRAGKLHDSPEQPALEVLEQKIVREVTQVLTSIFPSDQEKLSAVLDLLLSRLERVCGEMEAEDRAKAEASYQESMST